MLIGLRNLKKLSYLVKNELGRLFYDAVVAYVRIFPSIALNV
jgi:hypothetical protein